MTGSLKGLSPSLTHNAERERFSAFLYDRVLNFIFFSKVKDDFTDAWIRKEERAAGLALPDPILILLLLFPDILRSDYFLRFKHILLYAYMLAHFDARFLPCFARIKERLETLQTCPKQNDHTLKPQVAWKTGSRTEFENKESQKEKERVSPAWVRVRSKACVNVYPSYNPNPSYTS